LALPWHQPIAYELLFWYDGHDGVDWSPDHSAFRQKVKWNGALLQHHDAGANTMKKQGQGQPAPQVSSAEAAQTATEDAVDQFCWTVAQTLKRILGLAEPSADDLDVES
jgi:hypothetical protein